MKYIILMLVIYFPILGQASIWNDTKQAAEKLADTEILIDAFTELSDATTDEKALTNHLDEARKKNAAVRSSLMDLNYTKEEIDELLQNDSLTLDDLAGNISRTARRIKRVKALKSKLSLLTSGTPAAVNAVQSIEMNQTLRDIHTELTHQRMDRQIEKDHQRTAEIEVKLADKRKEAFFKRQFDLMQRSSKINNVSFFPFEDSEKGKSKEVTRFGLPYEY